MAQLQDDLVKTKEEIKSLRTVLLREIAQRKQGDTRLEDMVKRTSK